MGFSAFIEPALDKLAALRDSLGITLDTHARLLADFKPSQDMLLRVALQTARDEMQRKLARAEEALERAGEALEAEAERRAAELEEARAATDTALNLSPAHRPLAAVLVSDDLTRLILSHGGLCACALFSQLSHPLLLTAVASSPAWAGRDPRRGRRGLLARVGAQGRWRRARQLTRAAKPASGLSGPERGRRRCCCPALSMLCELVRAYSRHEGDLSMVGSGCKRPAESLHS